MYLVALSMTQAPPVPVQRWQMQGDAGSAGTKDHVGTPYPTNSHHEQPATTERTPWRSLLTLTRLLGPYLMQVSQAIVNHNNLEWRNAGEYVEA